MQKNGFYYFIITDIKALIKKWLTFSSYFTKKLNTVKYYKPSDYGRYPWETSPFRDIDLLLLQQTYDEEKYKI